MSRPKDINNMTEMEQTKSFGHAVPETSIIIDPWKARVKEVDVDETKYKIKKEILSPQFENKTLNELKYLITDLVAGDPAVLSRPEFKTFNFDLIKKALDWLNANGELTETTKTDLMLNGWRLNFKFKPPTPEEFLNEYYLGPTAETIYPHIREAFIEWMDPMKAYRTGCFYWSIGSGKSFLTVLTNLFISLHLALMYAPYKFFGGSPASVYVQTMASYSQKKSSELLIEPFLQVLETSEFFQKVRSHEILNKLDIELKHSDKLEHIYWSTATPSSVLQMSNKINYKLISSAMGLLGQSIVCGSCSEIAFLKSEGGWSDEKIMTFFSKLRQRISSRLRGNYYGRTILDTSPNSVIDSPIDDWIVNEATKNPKENFVLQGSRWKVFKNEFKNFYTITENLNPKDVSPITSNTENIVKTSDEIWTAKYHDWSVAFPIYLGGNGIPPLIIENEAQLQPFEENDIIWCPRVSDIGESYLDKAQENVIEFLKDMAGRPTSAVDRIFYDHRIIEKIFDNNLKNMYTHITADAMDEPEHLIWDQIKDLLFYKISNRYFYHYEPDIKRTISVDQSYAQDLTCIACSHVERDPTRIDPETNDSMKVFVTDFTVNLVPVRGQQINLDAIRYFIMDLIQLGNLIIGAVSFDNFQSIPTQQALKRFGLTVDYVTVDKINDPYLTFCSLINQNRYFCGKNLHFKNNLKSLQWVKRNKKTGTLKVDHTKGEIITEGNTDWQTGLFGKNSKDCSDATCASVYLLNLYPEKFVPYKIWDKNIIERSYQTVQNETSKMLDKLGLAL